MNYNIPIQGSFKKRSNSAVSHLLVSFGLIGIGAITYIMGNKEWAQHMFNPLIIPSNIIASLSFTYGTITLFLVFYKAKKLNDTYSKSILRTIHILVCLFLAIVFIISKWWFAGGICILLILVNMMVTFINKKMKEASRVYIDDNGIKLPSFSKRKYLMWPEIERVLLRHGNITIDSTDNFLFQWVYIELSFDAQEFEQYCKRKIEEHVSSRQSDDW